MRVRHHIRYLWERISNLGLRTTYGYSLQKEVIITNRMCLLLIPLLLLSILLEAANDNLPVVFSFIFFLIMVFIVIWMNARGSIKPARIILSVFPPVLLLSAPLISGEVNEGNYLGFSYALLGLSIIPLLIFHMDEERSYMLVMLIFHLLLLAFYDRILMMVDSRADELLWLHRNYALFKGTQIMLWIIFVGGVIFFKYLNLSYESRYLGALSEQERLHRAALEQNKEISSQNEELLQQQNQIVDQRNYIEAKNKELQQYQDKLLDYVFKISQTKDELFKKEAENKSILQALRQHFIVLEVDNEGKISWLAPKTIAYLDINPEELLQKNASSVFQYPEESSKSWSFENIREASQRSKALTDECQIVLPGRQLWVSCTFAPILDESGSIIRIMAIAHDISFIKEKEAEISDFNKLLQQQQQEIREQNDKLLSQKEEIATINETLEMRVEERTKVLEMKNMQLAEYAFINAHILRAPVSSILGLINLLGHENLSDEGRHLYRYLKQSADELDQVVMRINEAINEHKDFDRKYMRASDPPQDYQ